ncbi:MAG TPA: PIN domain-containing protein [Thermoplasmata archaeon]|nr:PIN domain-containing protein [Thermoplasmata archaeon]
MDTGPLVARVYAADAQHDESLEVFRGISERRLPYRLLYTSSYVVDEVLTRLLYEAGHAAAVEGLALLRGSTLLRIIHVTEEDERAADQAFRKYRDQRISYTDCTSKVVMERLGVETAFSFDSDFETMGFARIP